MPMICVECGAGAMKGSVKHPYCDECFKKLWNDDYNLYLNYLSDFHPRDAHDYLRGDQKNDMIVGLKMIFASVIMLVLVFLFYIVILVGSFIFGWSLIKLISK